MLNYSSLKDYEVNNVKTHTYKLKCNNNFKKWNFWCEKNLMAQQFKGSFKLSYWFKNNFLNAFHWSLYVLVLWHMFNWKHNGSMTCCQSTSRLSDTFKIQIFSKITAYSFFQILILSQKWNKWQISWEIPNQWRGKDFDIYLKTLCCFLVLLPCDCEVILLLQIQISMLYCWKSTNAFYNFHSVLSLFVESQFISEKNIVSKPSYTSTFTGEQGMITYGCKQLVWGGSLISPFHSNQNKIEHIISKPNIDNHGS